jgi:hypothetical protein
MMNDSLDALIHDLERTEHNNVTTVGDGSQKIFSELLPFDQSAEPPSFPLETLPTYTREFIYAASEAIQAPVDMVGVCVLGALEIACRGRYPVQLPSGHIERPCLYIAPIAQPSERKSGVIDVIARPLIDYETEYNQTHSFDVNQNKSESKLLQGRIAGAEQIVIKAKDAEARQIAELELQQLNKELAAFSSIEPLRLYSADVTPEKLADMLRAQGCVFALVSAEGGGLFENIGRYSDKGGLEIYLNGYSGDRICVDRKTSDSVVIDRPTLSIIAPCQPSVIMDLFSDRQKTGRGLLSRILFVKCPSRVGTRTASAAPLSEHIALNYRNLCFEMLSAQSSGNIEFGESVFSVYSDFFDEIEAQLIPDSGELSFMGDWAGKLPGQMTRLAGLIHCISAFEQRKNPLDTNINENEARAAAELARYFLAHAKAVYSEQAEPQSISNARYLWGKIRAMKTDKRNELYRSTQGKQNFNIDDSLTELINRGYIRIENISTGGRSSPRVIVNPETENIVLKVLKPSYDAPRASPTVPFNTFDTINPKTENANEGYPDDNGDDFPWGDSEAADAKRDSLALDDDFLHF